MCKYNINKIINRTRNVGVAWYATRPKRNTLKLIGMHMGDVKHVQKLYAKMAHKAFLHFIFRIDRITTVEYKQKFCKKY